MEHSTDSSSSSTPSSDGATYRLYHPYQELNIPAHYLYHLPTSPDFLFEEEAMRKRRSWSSTLSSCAGAGYVLGGFTGALKGSVDGLKSAETGESIKLRTSRVLSSGGHTARKFGSSVALIGMFYGALEGWLHSYRDTDDMWNNVIAGLGTGALYRSAAGPGAAAVAGAFGAVAAGVYVVGEGMFEKYVPLEPIIKRIKSPWIMNQEL